MLQLDVTKEKEIVAAVEVVTTQLGEEGTFSRDFMNISVEETFINSRGECESD